MEIKVTETQTSIKVYASIPGRRLASDPKIHVDSAIILENLTPKQRSEIRICDSESVLSNYVKDPVLEGNWVFFKWPKVWPFSENELGNAVNNFMNGKKESKSIEKPKTTRRSRRKNRTKSKPEPQKSWPYQEENKLFGTEDME